MNRDIAVNHSLTLFIYFFITWRLHPFPFTQIHTGRFVRENCHLGIVASQVAFSMPARLGLIELSVSGVVVHHFLPA